MEIKRVHSPEIEWVADLFDKYRIFYKQPSDIQLAQKFLEDRLENNESVIFVALVQLKNGRVPVGFTQLYPKYSSVRAIKYWVLNDLYVESHYRRQGIGEALIRTVLEFAKKEGSKFVELSTAVDNVNAQKLYESIGFKKLPADAGFYTYGLNLH